MICIPHNEESCKTCRIVQLENEAIERGHELEEMKKKYHGTPTKCNAGHTVNLPMALWTCPAHHDELDKYATSLQEALEEISYRGCKLARNAPDATCEVAFPMDPAKWCQGCIANSALRPGGLRYRQPNCIRELLVRSLERVEVMKKEDGTWIRMDGETKKSCVLVGVPMAIVAGALDEWQSSRDAILKIAKEC